MIHALAETTSEAYTHLDKTPDSICIPSSSFMMTSSNENNFCVTGLLCGEVTGEFPAKRPVKQSFDVFFELRLNEQFSTQSWGWWFETSSRTLWRHSNVLPWSTRQHVAYKKPTFSRPAIVLGCLLNFWGTLHQHNVILGTILSVN